MNFSIITCTYNPNRVIFERLIQSVCNLTIPENTLFEWIIVDNNSQKPIEYQFQKVNEIPFVNIIRETRQGLTYARITGIKNAKYNWIVFFDDDNEPSRDYLIEAEKIIQSNNLIACWGPGKIEVIFQNKNKWIEKYRYIYQERTIDGIKIHNAKEWQEWYPQGTGQISKKEVLIDYIKKVEAGIYSLSDRQGKSLSSGGDVQIVMNAIKMGYLVGISGSLKLCHNIEKNKATFRYLFRLIYGMASSAILAQVQVFPGLLQIPDITNKMVLKTIWLYFRQYKFQSFTKDKLRIFAQRIGNLNAASLANKNSSLKPKILKIAERICF